MSELDLQSFLLGRLPERVSQTVSIHLETCPECQAVAERLDPRTDPLVRALRRAAHPAAANETSPSQVGTADTATSKSHAFPEILPERIGTYEILEVAGRGGMSVVYKARQAHPERIVALKMILAGVHGGIERQVRFLSEADAIARLQHPHIVQIYEVGQHEGLPFFSLEFVSGGSLADRLNGTPQPPRQAAALVKTLAEAIHHAHKHGVVHRDLKPSNILLVSGGVGSGESSQASGATTHHSPLTTHHAKITDFGLAKQERPELTATGAILGTPSYMAPEQASGNNAAVGPPADIYSLGVILYELLTGRPPFRAATVQETLQQVRVQEPVAPTSLQPRLPRGLETICLKCLEKEPRRRFASAEALAADLGHFLNGETIEARPSPAWERLAKRVRQRPVASLAIGFGALATLGLVIMWAVFTLQLQRERNAAARSAQEANDERVRAEAQRARAETNESQALDAVDQFLTQVGDRRLADIPEMEEVRQELLQEALRFCEKFLHQSPNPDRNVRYQAARTYGRMAKILQTLARFEPAEKHYQSALSLLRQLTDEFPEDPAYRYELAKNYYNLTILYGGSDRSSAAAPFLFQALDLQEHLIQEDPRSLDYRRGLASTLSVLANLRRDQGRTTDAEALLNRCMTIREEVCREQPEDDDARAALLRAQGAMGLLLFSTQRVVDAEKWFRQGRDQWHTLAKKHPQNSTYQDEFVNKLNSLGVVYENLGRMTGAVAAYQQCVAGKRALVAKHPTVVGCRFSLAWSCTNLGSAYAKAGQPAEAEAAYREGKNLLEELAREGLKTGDHVLQLAKNEAGMATVWHSLGLLDQAEAGFRSAAVLLEPLVKKEPENQAYAVDLALAYRQLGIVLTDRDKPQNALDWFGRAFTLLEAVLKKSPRHTFALEFIHEAHEGRARALTALGRYDEARVDWKETMPYRHDARSVNHHAVWQALSSVTHHQFAEALSRAQTLDKAALASGDGVLIYHLAHVYALTSAPVPSNHLADDQRERCALRAVELLHLLATQKYFEKETKRAILRNDQAFVSLQERADFVGFCKLLDRSDQRIDRPSTHGARIGLLPAR
jgi:serine/threonine-protein kinase